MNFNFKENNKQIYLVSYVLYLMYSIIPVIYGVFFFNDLKLVDILLTVLTELALICSTFIVVLIFNYLLKKYQFFLKKYLIPIISFIIIHSIFSAIFISEPPNAELMTAYPDSGVSVPELNNEVLVSSINSILFFLVEKTTVYSLILILLMLKFSIKQKRTRVCLNLSAGKFYIFSDKICSIEAEGNYVKVNYLDDHKIEQILVRSSLKQIICRLGEAKKSFVHVHRSYLVNWSFVDSFNKSDQKISININGAHVEIPVSRLKLKEVEEKFHCHMV